MENIQDNQLVKDVIAVLEGYKEKYNADKIYDLGLVAIGFYHNKLTLEHVPDTTTPTPSPQA